MSSEEQRAQHVEDLRVILASTGQDIINKVRTLTHHVAESSDTPQESVRTLLNFLVDVAALVAKYEAISDIVLKSREQS